MSPSEVTEPGKPPLRSDKEAAREGRPPAAMEGRPPAVWVARGTPAERGLADCLLLTRAEAWAKAQIGPASIPLAANCASTQDLRDRG
jgi:hypothetical protein